MMLNFRSWVILLAIFLSGCVVESSSPFPFVVQKMNDEWAQEYDVDPFYKKAVLVHGMLIVGSEDLMDVTLLEAAHTTNELYKTLKPEVVQRLKNEKMRFVIIGQGELSSNIPELARKDLSGKELHYYNWRNRGMNTRRNGRRIVICGEEDVMELEGGMQIESILIHELAHAIHWSGMKQPEFNKRLEKVYKNAMAQGLWQNARAAHRYRRCKSATPVSLLKELQKDFPDYSEKFFKRCFDEGRILVNRRIAAETVKITKEDKVLIKLSIPSTQKKGYASKNMSEYFAEGVQAWFNTNRIHDHDHNYVNTREELKLYDHGLAELCEEIFGDGPYRYQPLRKRLHEAHLKGYNPKTAPKFKQPDIINEAAYDYYDKYWKPHWEALRSYYAEAS